MISSVLTHFCFQCFRAFDRFLVFVLFGRMTILVKKLFRLKMFTLLETRITSKRFSILFAFLKFLTAFRFCAFWLFWLCQRFLNDYF